MCEEHFLGIDISGLMYLLIHGLLAVLSFYSYIKGSNQLNNLGEN